MEKYNDRDTVMCSSLTFAEACEAHFKKVEYFKEIVELPLSLCPFRYVIDMRNY